MPNNSEKAISLAEFARRMDCDESTVRRYVKEGRICGAAVAYRANGKIAGLFFDLAKPHYLEARALVELRFVRSGGAPTGKADRNAPVPVPAGSQPTPTKPAGTKLESARRLSEAELNELEINDLAKLEVVLRILTKQIQIQELLSSLVDIDEVESAFNEFTQIIRARMEAIPDRIIDSLITTAGNRTKAKQLLIEELDSALSELSGMGTFAVSKTD